VVSIAQVPNQSASTQIALADILTGHLCFVLTHPLGTLALSCVVCVSSLPSRDSSCAPTCCGRSTVRTGARLARAQMWYSVIDTPNLHFGLTWARSAARGGTLHSRRHRTLSEAYRSRCERLDKIASRGHALQTGFRVQGQ